MIHDDHERKLKRGDSKEKIQAYSFLKMPKTFFFRWDFSGDTAYFNISCILRPKTHPTSAFRTPMLALIWVRGITLLVKSCCLIVICWIEVTLASVVEMQ